MSRRYRRSRHGHWTSLAAAMAVLAAIAIIAAVVDLAEHLAVAGAIIAVAALAFAAGRRYERAKPRGRAPVTPPPAPAAKQAASPDPAGQLEQLEQLAGRPIEAILATYQRVARYHGGPR